LWSVDELDRHRGRRQAGALRRPRGDKSADQGAVDPGAAIHEACDHIVIITALGRSGNRLSTALPCRGRFRVWQDVARFWTAWLLTWSAARRR